MQILRLLHGKWLYGLSGLRVAVAVVAVAVVVADDVFVVAVVVGVVAGGGGGGGDSCPLRARLCL